MFANGQGDLGLIPDRVIPKTQNMAPDAILRNTQHYKVCVKWSNPGKGVAPFLHLSVVAIEKGAFGLPSTTVANFTFTIYIYLIYIYYYYYYIYIYILHGNVCDLEFHAFCIRQTEWRFFLKKTINMVNFLFEKWGLFVCVCMCVCVSKFVLLNVSMIVNVLLFTRTYIRMFVYVLLCIFTYVHISAVCCSEGVRQKKETMKRREWWRDGGNRLLQSKWFLFLSNFMVAKDLFWFEYEMSVFWGILLSDDDDDDDDD